MVVCNHTQVIKYVEKKSSCVYYTRPFGIKNVKFQDIVSNKLEHVVKILILH